MATSVADTDFQLLQKFAPVLYLHPQEANFPSSVEWYLQRVRLLDETGTVVSTFHNDAASLADTSLNQRTNWTLDVLDTSTYIGDKDNLASVPCYGYVRPVLDSNGKQVATDLAYWFFYPYNGNIFNTAALAAYITGTVIASGPVFFIPVIGPLMALVRNAATIAAIVELIQTADGIGKHEGDWEMVTVRLNADQSAIAQLFTSAHAGGAWTTSYDQNPGDNRPIVYVAQYSHANYTTKGTQFRLAGCANDHTDSSAYKWDTKNTVVNIGWNPKAQQLISWKPCTPASIPLNSPYMPSGPFSIASAVLDDAGNLVYCGTTPAGKQYNYTYMLNKLALDAENNPHITLPGGVFNPNGAFSAGDSAPALASNNSGTVVTAMISGTDVWWNLASVTPNGNTVSFWLGGGGRPLSRSFTSPMAINASADPAIAINDNNTVLLAYRNTSGSYTYWGGAVSLTSDAPWQDWRGILWWPQPIANSDRGDSSPSIALSTGGIVVAVRSSKGTLFYSIGKLDTANQTITWNLFNIPFGNGSNPCVAMNKDGTVLETHETDGTLYYHIGEVAEHNGLHSITWSNGGPSFNHGQGTSFGRTKDNPSIALIDGLVPPGSLPKTANETTSAQDNERPVVAIQAATDGWQTGIVGVDNFDNWQPNGGAAWLKYSGHWGNKATDPIIDLAGISLAEVEEGPTGPAYKRTWLTGPEDE